MNVFSFVKSRVSILDVVGEYTTLRKAGLYWKATCPFHAEKDASFTVSPHREIFYCFGCHAGGDVIAFIEKAEGCSPIEAVKFLVDRFNVEIPDEVKWENCDRLDIREKESYFNVCKNVALWANRELLNSKDALAYLLSRGLDKNSIEEYTLGYFPSGSRSISRLLKDLATKNVIPHDLLEANIVAQSKASLYSPFEDRIIFPICDHLGRFCGFGGRIYKKYDERAKYYNSRENKYFQKGKILFGLNIAKNDIKKSLGVLLVEGYTDCIAMRQNGFKNTVSTLGTACTRDHLTAVSRYCDTISVVYDGDSAGQAAVIRLPELCWQVGLDLRVVTLPPQEDPASFLSKDGNLGKCLAQSRDIFEFFIDSMGKDFHSKPFGERVKRVKTILKSIVRIDDGIKRAVLLQQASGVFGIPYKALEDGLVRPRADQSRMRDKDRQADAGSDSEFSRKALSDISTLEKKVFFAIINNVQIFQSVKDSEIMTYFSEPLCSIMEFFKREKSNDVSIEFEDFFSQLDKPSQQLVSAIILETNQEVGFDEFSRLIEQFKRKHWKRLINNIKLQMDSEKGDSSKELLLKDLLMVKNKIFKDRM